MLHQYTYFLGLIKLIFYKIVFRNKICIHGVPRLSHKVSFRMRKNSKINLNRKTYFAEGTLLRVTDNAIFSIGDNSGFNSYCVITCREFIKIGNNVMFGPFVTIHDHDHIYKTKECMKISGYISAPIIIEDNVWIGANVTILKGVTIGSGSVVAAGSIVTKDIPPNTIFFNKVDPIMKKIN